MKVIKAYIFFAAGIAIVPFLPGLFPTIFPLTIGMHLYFILMLLFPKLELPVFPYLIHPCLYLLLNLYILRRVFRNIALTPARAFLPSQIAVLILTGFSIWYWLSQWREGIYGFPDPINLIRFGVLNIVVLFLLVITPGIILRYLASHKRPFSEVFVLGYNFFIYSAFLLIFFPWMGEAFL